MIATTIRITDQATPALARLAQALGRPRPITEAAAQATVVELQKHFLARNREPNKRGWTKQNFWTKEGRNKTAIDDLQDTRAIVAVASPAVAHKFTGGTIKPKRGKYLAQPLTDRAYQAGSPREGGIDGLFPIVSRGRIFLATREGPAIRVQYMLRTSVTHAADPRTLPDSATLGTAAEKAAGRALRTLIAQSTGGPAPQS